MSYDAESFERRVRALEAMGHRGSATANEDQAADYLVRELLEAGIEAEKTGFRGYTSLGWRMLAHVGLSAVAGALAFVSPFAAIALGGIVAISWFIESLTLGVLVSHLLPSSTSRNVHGRIPATEATRRRVLLIGHMDTQRTGWLWRPEIVDRFGKSAAGLPGPLKSPLWIVTLAIVFVPILSALAATGVGSTAVTTGLAATLVVNLVAAIILGQWGGGQFVPGACDNATGSAAVLCLAEAWLEDPVPDVELMLLVTGCEESGLIGAMQAARELERDDVQTYFVNLDTLGYCAPRYIGCEYSYAATPVRMPAEVLAVCADAAAELGLEDAGPHTLPVCGDSLAFSVRGIPGASILTFEPGPHMPNYHQMTDTSDRMDFAVGWQAVELGNAVARGLAALP